MADKEVTIKVTTEADASQLEDLQNVMEETKQKATEISTEGATSMEELGSASEEASASLSDASTEADNLSNSTGQMDTSGLDEASVSADELSSSTSEAESSVESLANSMGLIDSAVMMDMANQIGAIGDKSEGLAQEMNTASISVGQLATQTGIAEPKLRQLVSYYSNSTFPQEEAMMYIKSLDQIGVSSENLGKSAQEMDWINDAFGLGASTVNSLGQELSVLGVDMNNVSSAYNALAYANANTVGGMENYYSFLRKYDAEFHEMGFNVDQASVIIAGATQKFGGGRSALSGLSTALKDCNGDTRALEEALDLQAGSISNATALTGQYEGQLMSLADEEAEHKTITEELGAVWEDLSLMLSPVLSPLMSFIGLIGTIGQTALAVNSILTLAETFGLLKTANLALIPSQIAEGLAGWFSIGWIVVAIALGIALGLALVYLWNNSEQFRNAVMRLGNGLKWLAGIIVTNIMNQVNRFRQIIMGIPNAIQSCLSWAYNIIMNHPIVQAIIWLGEKLAWGFSALGLGQHSPGKIVKAMEQELDWTEDAINNTSLVKSTARLGASLSDNFNPTLNNISTNDVANDLVTSNLNNMEGTGSTEVNNTFNLGYFTKKEFVDEIIDIIKNEVFWDNKTAGRTN